MRGFGRFFQASVSELYDHKIFFHQPLSVVQNYFHLTDQNMSKIYIRSQSFINPNVKSFQNIYFNFITGGLASLWSYKVLKLFIFSFNNIFPSPFQLVWVNECLDYLDLLCLELSIVCDNLINWNDLIFPKWIF